MGFKVVRANLQRMGRGGEPTGHCTLDAGARRIRGSPALASQRNREVLSNILRDAVPRLPESASLAGLEEREKAL